MKQICDILVIGGGAAGLFAAITAANAAHGRRVVVLERELRVGKKLLTTGNGRCNLSNTTELKGRYSGDIAFAAKAFSFFGVEETRREMKKIGIDSIELENGKLFPRSLQAGSVVDMLRFAAADLGVEIITETTVLSIKAGESFAVKTDKDLYIAQKVLIATGGKSCVGKYAGPTGYDLLESTGHTATKLTPAIVQITTEKEPIKPLVGIKVEGVVTAKAGGEQRTEAGEILFADYGVSGPPVLQVSGLIARHGGGEIILDLLPDLTMREIKEEITQRCRWFKDRTCEDLLTGFMNKRLGQTVIKRAGIQKLSLLCGSLTEKDIDNLSTVMKAFLLKATGTKGWNAAQVTAGGIKTKDFDAATMESKLVPGLYAAGEVLNVTGDCGGFNLQWAWTSGYLAGRAMGESKR